MTAGSERPIHDEAAPAPPMIEVRDLAVIFAKGGRPLPVLFDVSFRVGPGEAFGLVGESGSGKTTVLRALAGLIRSFRGHIAIDGAIRYPGRINPLPHTVQMVFQDPYGSLHPRQTVDRILSEPLAIHGIEDRPARIARALDEVGLSADFRFRFPHQLSGGERQRVAIARALMLAPKVLLLDEPTSALDQSIQAEVLELLLRLKERSGLTYVLVSHDLALTAMMCERVAVMRAGRIVEECSRADLRAGRLADPYSRALWAASRGYRRPRPGESRPVA